MKKAFLYIEFEELGRGGHHTFTLNSYANYIKHCFQKVDPILTGKYKCILILSDLVVLALA